MRLTLPRGKVAVRRAAVSSLQSREMHCALETSKDTRECKAMSYQISARGSKEREE